jgi:hypothetical protein
MSKPASSSAAAAVPKGDKKGENVKVVVRCRPLNSGERERQDQSIVQMDPKLGSSQFKDMHRRVERAGPADSLL